MSESLIACCLVGQTMFENSPRTSLIKDKMLTTKRILPCDRMLIQYECKFCELMRIRNNLPNFVNEQALWRKGFRFVAGVDEVGRGAWAGPVVAAATVWQRDQNLKFKIENAKLRIDDSKRLNSQQREVSAAWIKENALAWGIGEVGPQIINRVGMARASKMVFRAAIAAANSKLKAQNSKVDFLLIDAFYIPYVNGVRRKNQLAIIKGDQKSFSIAAASIIAKVYRDKLMRSLSKQSKFKKYGWGKNKAYGTREHQKAILKHGITRLHRRKFVETWRVNRGTTQNNTRNNARSLA